MAEQITHTKNGKIEQFGRICFYAGLLLELLIVILDKSSWINPLEGQMFRVSFLLFACKLCVTKYSKKEWLAVLAAGVIAGLCYLSSDRDEAVRVVVFVASMKGIDHKKALRVVDVYKRQFVGCVEDGKALLRSCCLCVEEGKAFPVSYTHLDVYKRQIGNRKAGN